MNAHKVIWQEGMLLRPQHLQHNDRYHDHQLKTRTCLLGAYNWGFFSLVIDLQFLNMGKLVVSEASGVLPDGSLFELGNTPEPLALDVPANTVDTAVYLGLPLVTGNHIEARHPEQSDVLARYTVYQTQVSDSNAGEQGSTAIHCARPDLRLLLGEPSGEQAWVRLKICQIREAAATGAITLAADFIPSFVHLQASPWMLSCLKEVISLLAHRGDTIAERIRGSGTQGSAQVGDLLMLQLINRNELLLRHCLAQPRVAPEALYRLLLGLLGELATFASDSKRPVLDSHYRHNDQGASLRPLLEAIRQVLSMVLEQHAIELPLQQRQYGVQVAILHDHSLLASSSFVLAASALCDSEELRQRLPAHLKAGAVEHIRQLVNLHLPGIRLKPLPVAPRQIPFHANKTYFVLEPDREALELLGRSGGFAFHVAGEFAGLELTFWAIRN
ncbi:type VI secretion system baseplate subunit TssK [Pseudomonas sp. 21LCFQ02]|nr:MULTISPECIES: type VI secretion system baseplate subunit TssK [unclassified Pseudomonas]MCO8163806.1 type VI secretion system baseplate subunit TssK [Pseudomonas sp. 21LCFQ010]MCO8170764.1 type VI secretion system baseplate subunit TssK [Pseudomonas sp. 21LCFQ02]MCQ9422394.1 type VI secretion system baseplate subunit TssK [Pseudomonas sp. LJDD11]BAP45739.1 type VI secretion protein TssK2 [Pseudomonas sp. StFLB209]